jgi:two-component system, chemotaxis family, chemotaxis protein CheY
MKALVVDDDFLSRKIIQRILAPCGQCDIAVDGNEAIKAVTLAWEEGKKYDLMCLDIMMPGTDGQEALARIRALEKERGIGPGEHLKVIMTTALSDIRNVMEAYHRDAEAYLVKPIEPEKLIEQLELLGLVAQNGTISAERR